MNIRSERRDAAVERMAEHLLREGLAGARLRALAVAAGVSDRMLLYYFADKDEILAVTLQHVATRLAEQLDAALPRGPALPPDALLGQVWGALKSEGVRPFMRLWLDVAAGAAGGGEPHRSVAGAIADGFLAWIERRLEPVAGDRGARAARLLATVEGMLVLDAVGRGPLADLAAGL